MSNLQKVELFDCVLQHGGNKDHEIPKVGVTAREIFLLRAMHGEGAVPDREVKPHYEKGKTVQATRDIEPKMELFELARKYANTADPMSGKKIVERVFSTSLVGFEKWYEESVELERMEQEEAMVLRQREANLRREAAEAAAKKSLEQQAAA